MILLLFLVTVGDYRSFDNFTFVVSICFIRAFAPL